MPQRDTNAVAHDIGSHYVPLGIETISKKLSAISSTPVDGSDVEVFQRAVCFDCITNVKEGQCSCHNGGQ